jgi:hypothetical protein
VEKHVARARRVGELAEPDRRRGIGEVVDLEAEIEVLAR